MAHTILLGPNRVILDSTNQTTHPKHFTSAQTRATANGLTTSTVSVDSLPENFSIGHVLSADNLSCTGRDDDHHFYLIPRRRGEVVRWAQKLLHAPHMPLLIAEVVTWGPVQETMKPYNFHGTMLGLATVTLVAAKEDSNLTDGNKWNTIKKNLEIELNYFFDNPMIWGIYNPSNWQRGLEFKYFDSSGNGRLSTPTGNGNPVMNPTAHLAWAKSIIYPSTL